MSAPGQRNFTWIAVGVAAAAVTLAGTYLALERSAERILEDVWTAEAATSVRVLAAHIRGHLDDLTESLTEIAPRCAMQETAPAAECASELERLRRRQPRLFLATMLFDAAGRVVATVPDRDWTPEERSGAEGACARALGREGGPVELAVTRSSRDRTVFAVARIGTATNGPVRAIGVAVDGAQLTSALLAGMTADGPGSRSSRRRTVGSSRPPVSSARARRLRWTTSSVRCGPTWRAGSGRRAGMLRVRFASRPGEAPTGRWACWRRSGWPGADG